MLKEQRTLTISEAARELGVSPSWLRFGKRLRALPSARRTSNGWRYYTLEDIERYQLPPDFTKATDSRSNAFVARYGDVAVELDALPGEVLRGRLIREVEAHMD